MHEFTHAGLSHRLFLIDREVLEAAGSEGGGREKFVVLRATGNVYEVEIGKHPKCSCPDAAKGNICKHRFFVMLCVLKLDQNDPSVWQQALLSSEVCVFTGSLPSSVSRLDCISMLSFCLCIRALWVP